MLKIILFFLSFFITNSSYSLDRSDGGRGKPPSLTATQKQEKKYQERWTISDWFETKKAIGDQNRWLSMNRSTVKYEFFAGAEQTTFELKETSAGTTTTTNYTLTRAGGAAYNSIFGIHANYFDSSNHKYGWDASLNIRIYGKSIQHTNLTLIYGGKTIIDNTQTQSETFRYIFYGASFALYLFKQFGIEGLYQKIEDAKGDLGVTTISGNNIEAMVFIDYGVIRVQGTMFQETLNYLTNASTSTDRISSGLLGGFRVYF